MSVLVDKTTRLICQGFTGFSRVAFVAFALALGACEEAPRLSVTPGTVQSGAATIASQNPPVTATRAVALFDAVCGASLKDEFASAAKLAKANGVSVPSPFGTPTIYSGTEDLSFQVQDGPGFGKTCSMVFGSTQPKATVMAGVSQINPFRPSDIGLMALYRDQQRLVLFVDGGSAVGKTHYYNLRLLSDH